jgi:nucleoside phosphorylase
MPTVNPSTDWSSPPETREGFEVAIFCALGHEHDAVRFICDRLWSDENIELGKAAGDKNEYNIGLIGKHSVVLVQLPHMGKEAAATAAAFLRMSYPRVRLALLVGICGGTPKNVEGQEVMLGDVIISHEIVQYDFGRLYSHGVDIRDTTKHIKSDPHISAFVERLQSGDSWRRLNEHVVQHLEDLRHRDKDGKYKHPGFSTDILFEPKSRHKHHQATERDCACGECKSRWQPVCEEAQNKSCTELGCNQNEQIRRDLSGRIKQAAKAGRAYEARIPVLHFGVMGCGDLVIKCAEHRDQIAKRVGAIAFEMESAGICQTFAGVVIKAVCDYADSHKNKSWQFYAAATAAAATKALLEQFTPSDRPPLMAPINCESEP